MVLFLGHPQVWRAFTLLVLLPHSIGISFRTATCTTCAQAQSNRPKTLGADVSVRPHFSVKSTSPPTSRLVQSRVSYLRWTLHRLSLCCIEYLIFVTHWFHLEKKVTSKTEASCRYQPHPHPMALPRWAPPTRESPRV